MKKINMKGQYFNRCGIFFLTLIIYEKEGIESELFMITVRIAQYKFDRITFGSTLAIPCHSPNDSCSLS